NSCFSLLKDAFFQAPNLAIAQIQQFSSFTPCYETINPPTNNLVTHQFFFAHCDLLLSHSDIFTDALQYDNITDEQPSPSPFLDKKRSACYNCDGIQEEAPRFSPDRRTGC